MKKRTGLRIGIAALLVTGLAAGCGVQKKESETISAEVHAAALTGEINELIHDSLNNYRITTEVSGGQIYSALASYTVQVSEMSAQMLTDEDECELTEEQEGALSCEIRDAVLNKLDDSSTVILTSAISEESQNLLSNFISNEIKETLIRLKYSGNAENEENSVEDYAQILGNQIDRIVEAAVKSYQVTTAPVSLEPSGSTQYMMKLSASTDENVLAAVGQKVSESRASALVNQAVASALKTTALYSPEAAAMQSASEEELSSLIAEMNLAQGEDFLSGDDLTALAADIKYAIIQNLSDTLESWEPRYTASGLKEMKSGIEELNEEVTTVHENIAAYKAETVENLANMQSAISKMATKTDMSDIQKIYDTFAQKVNAELEKLDILGERLDSTKVNRQLFEEYKASTSEASDALRTQLEQANRALGEKTDGDVYSEYAGSLWQAASEMRTELNELRGTTAADKEQIDEVLGILDETLCEFKDNTATRLVSIDHSISRMADTLETKLSVEAFATYTGTIDDKISEMNQVLGEKIGSTELSEAIGNVTSSLDQYIQNASESLSSLEADVASSVESLQGEIAEQISSLNTDFNDLLRGKVDQGEYERDQQELSEQLQQKVSSGSVSGIQVLTREEYAAMTEFDPSVLYIVVG